MVAQLRNIAVRASMLALTLLAVGCVSGYSWRNPHVDATQTARQFQIDSAECTAFAMRSIPLPRRQPYPASSAIDSPPDYAMNGTATTYDTRGNIRTSTFSGTATPYGGGSSTTNAFAQGVANYQMISERNQAYRARDKLKNACLLRRGWEKARRK